MSELEEFTIDAFPEKGALEKDSEPHLLRVPNYVHIEQRPWDVDTFESLMAHQEQLRQEEVARTGMEKDTVNPLGERGAIRWRYKRKEGDDTISGMEEGAPKQEEMESNARLVRWSDGSMQLLVGDKYVYDVDHHNINTSNTFLYTNINSGSGLMCLGKMKQRLGLQPASKEAKLQQKIALAIANAASAKEDNSVKRFNSAKNPHLRKEEIEKEEQRRQRELTRQQKKVERTLSGYGYSADATRRFIQEDHYDEESEEEADEEEELPGSSMARYQLERKRKSGQEDKMEQRILDAKEAAMTSSKSRVVIDDDDEDDDGDVTMAEAKPKRRIIEESDEEE